jgi:AraC-like DNA-binding protein
MVPVPSVVRSRHLGTTDSSDFVHSFSNTTQVALCNFPLRPAEVERLIHGVDELPLVSEPAQSTCVAILHKAGRHTCAAMGITESWFDLWTEALCVRDFVSVSQLLRKLLPSRDTDHRIVAAVRQHIARHHADPKLSAADTADALGITRRRLAAALSKAGVGSYRQLLRRTRVTRALGLLRAPGFSIKAAAFACGFRHASEFSRACVEVTGTSPRRLARRVETRRSEDR